MKPCSGPALLHQCSFEKSWCREKPCFWLQSKLWASGVQTAMHWPNTVAPVQLWKELVQRKALPVTAVSPVSFWGANTHAVAQHCCTSAALQSCCRTKHSPQRFGSPYSTACDVEQKRCPRPCVVTPTLFGIQTETWIYITCIWWP